LSGRSSEKRDGDSIDENVGSRARDHLANERTYLAWVRTALGGIALGIALERFGRDGSDASVTFWDC
jgi:uncharacterized membrane protein YidH (DUF202 family)